MPKKFLKLPVVFLVFLAAPATSQIEPTEITAQNGQEVVLHSDEFADRHEYSIRLEKPEADNIDIGSAILLVVRQGEKFAGPAIQGEIYYDGDWRYYQSAVFQGGTGAQYFRTGSDVGSCGRYGCSKIERFTVILTPEDIEAHSNDGVLKIQVRARDSNQFFLSVPVDTVEAILQVSEKD